MSPRWVPPSDARAERPVGVARSSCRRPTSTSTSPATSTPSRRPTTCLPRWSTITSTMARSRASIRVASLATGHRPQRPGSAACRHRPRWPSAGRAAGDRFRHHAGLRGDGGALSGRGRRGSARGCPASGGADLARRAGDRGRPQAVGAMMVLLKEAIHPNLVQTMRGCSGAGSRRAVRQHRPRL